MSGAVKFACVLVVLAVGAATATAATGAGQRHRVKPGHAVLLGPRTRTSDCALASQPDRRCTPGAYSRRLTKAIICSAHFHTDVILRLPRSTKYRVEREYGLPAGLFRRALEIDHVVPLRLGGSNNIANLFPEEYAFADRSPGYPAKDRLDKRLRELVCAGRLRLRVAQRRIAADWESLYRQVFGGVAGDRKP
jgi:hypothetical protein